MRADSARPARIFFTLWIYGTSEGVASARELERLCGMHDAYRWIRGGVAACAIACNALKLLAMA